MMTDALGPAAIAALRRSRRRSLCWATAGLLITVLVIGLLVRAEIGDEDQFNPSGLGGFLVAGPIMLWYGMVIVPRRVRALRSGGVEMKLRPLTATGRRRREGLGRQPREDISYAWLVASAPEDPNHDLAVPVEPAAVAAIADETLPMVRGRWEAGGHVVVEYPDRLLFPIGPIQKIPAGLAGHVAYWRVVGLDEPEPFWNRFERKQRSTTRR